MTVMPRAGMDACVVKRDRQRTEDFDDHDEVAQLTVSTVAVAVTLFDTKFKPVTVIEAEPENGMFRTPLESTGASNDNTARPVETTSAMVVTTVVVPPPT